MNTKKVRHEQIQANCVFRAQLWREFLASYESVLDRSPEGFSEFCADFRKRFVRGHSAHGPVRRGNREGVVNAGKQ